MLIYTCAIFMLLTCKAWATGGESCCQVTVDQNNCTVQIKISLQDGLIKERRPFKVFYNSSTVIASLEPIGEAYRCIAAADVDCKQFASIFSITIGSNGCIHDVELSADGEQNIPCTRYHPNFAVATQEDDINDGPTKLKYKEAHTDSTSNVTGVICLCVVVVIIIVAVSSVNCRRNLRNCRGRASAEPDNSAEVERLNKQDTFLSSIAKTPETNGTRN